MDEHPAIRSIQGRELRVFFGACMECINRVSSTINTSIATNDGPSREDEFELGGVLRKIDKIRKMRSFEKLASISIWYASEGANGIVTWGREDYASGCMAIINGVQEMLNAGTRADYSQWENTRAVAVRIEH